MMLENEPLAVPSAAETTRRSAPAAAPAPEEARAPGPGEPVLRDRFGRVFDYLRIAVTDRCNLRCIYCMPEEGIPFTPRDRSLRAEEILRIVRVAAGLGVKKIRLTGGEPTLHPEITQLVRGAARTPGIRSVHLTTNGLLLEGLAAPLRDAGLHGLNVSLDTLDRERFERYTRRDGLDRVRAGLRAALAAGFPALKVNVVALRGFNEGELMRFPELTRTDPLTVRFIELMPFDAHQIWRSGHFLRAEEIVAQLRAAYPGLEPDSGSSTEHFVFRLRGYAGRVAVIPSYSRDMCAGCTRVRVTADGRIRNCLYSEEEYDLMGLLRNGGSDADLARGMQRAMWEKLRDGREAQERALLLAPGHPRQSMTQIGG